MILLLYLSIILWIYHSNVTAVSLGLLSYKDNIFFSDRALYLVGLYLLFCFFSLDFPSSIYSMSFM